MDKLMEVREEARRRYEEYYEREKREKKEKERQELTTLENELKKEDDHTYIYEQFDEWDSLSLSKSDQDLGDIIVTLHLYYSLLNPYLMGLLKKYDRIDELQERVVKLVHFLNELSQKNQFDLHEIREMGNVMEMMIRLSDVDIPIEMMDTTKDEELSKRLHAQLNNENNENNENIENIENIKDEEVKEEEKDEVKEEVKEEKEEAVEILPSVSLSSTRIGLRLPAMRAIAKANGIPSTGTKKELAERLSACHLVQIV